MTTDRSREVLATVAVYLDKARGLLVQIRDEGRREWPEEMENDEVPPSLEFRIGADVGMLLEDYVEPGLAVARDACQLTESAVTDEWHTNRRAAAEREAETTLHPVQETDDDNPVPYFLAEVAAVFNTAHALRGKKRLTHDERIILSKAIRLQSALLGEENLSIYTTRALSERDLPAELDDPEDLRTPVWDALTSLSKSAQGLSAMLTRVLGVGLDIGLNHEAMSKITEAIDELSRRITMLLAPAEDA